MGRLVVIQSTFDDPRLRRIEEYLRTHLRDPKRLSLRDAARISNLCPEHFCRLFRQRAGVRFGDWQCAFRTDQAKTLLLNTQLRVELVGERVGYPNPSTFARVFKRCQGVGPMALRTFVRAHPDLRPVLISVPWPEPVIRISALNDTNPLCIVLLRTLAEHMHQLSSSEGIRRS